MKRILLAPGLGDIHWVLLKLQSWIKRRGWDEVEVSLWDVDGRPRSGDYLRMIPWLKVGPDFKASMRHPPHVRAAFNKVYEERNTTDSVLNFMGYDALVGVNGNMRNGVPFKDIMEGAEVNHAYGPMLTNDYGFRQMVNGPYFVLFFTGHGMYASHWNKCIDIKALVKALKERFPRHRFIFTGLEWDREFNEGLSEGYESLVNQTTLPELLSLISYSDGFIGWAAGNAIVAQHLGVKTVVWWSKKYFPTHDRTGWASGPQMVLEAEDPIDVDAIYRFLKT